MNRSEFIEQYYKIVERALHCSEKAKAEGILALEKELYQDKADRRDIFEYGLRFVIDGFDSSIIRYILSNIINQENDEYTVKIKNIQLEAVLSIQADDNYRIIYCKLNSFTDLQLNDEESKKYLREWSF